MRRLWEAFALAEAAAVIHGSRLNAQGVRAALPRGGIGAPKGDHSIPGQVGLPMMEKQIRRMMMRYFRYVTAESEMKCSALQQLTDDIK